MAGVETACVTAHGHQTGLLLQLDQFLAFFEHIAHGTFHFHMLACEQTGLGLCGMHLGGGAQNHRVHLFDGQALVQIRGDMANAVLLGDVFGFF